MNSLDDFTIAMNMYTYAEQPVSRGKLLGEKVDCWIEPTKMECKSHSVVGQISNTVSI